MAKVMLEAVALLAMLATWLLVFKVMEEGMR